MLLFKLFLVSGLIAIGALSVEAADLEMKLVDKNCWIEVFDDSKYDAKNPHLKLQGPKEYPTLKNIEGKDWNNEIEIMQAHDKFENFREKQHDIGFKTFSWFRAFFSPQLMGADSSVIKTMPIKAIINPGNMNEFMSASGNLFNEATYQYEPSLEKQLALDTWLIEKIHKEYPSK